MIIYVCVCARIRVCVCMYLNEIYFCLNFDLKYMILDNMTIF